MGNYATTTKFIKSGTEAEVETDIDTYLATVVDTATIRNIDSFRMGGDYITIIIHDTP